MAEAIKMGGETLGRKFEAAERHLKEVKKKPAKPALPNLDAIMVVVETPEQIAQRVEEAKRLRAYAQKAAKIVMGIRARLAQIDDIERQTGSLALELANERMALGDSEAKILAAGDDASMRERIMFALLMEQIGSAPATKSAANALLRQAVDAGRFRIATDKDDPLLFRTKVNDPPVGPQQFCGVGYIPLFDSRQDCGQYALEAELGKYLACVESTRCAALLHGGTHDLERMYAGQCNRYVLHFRERRTPGKPMLAAGVGVISVEKVSRKGGGEKTIAKVVDGAGRLGWMAACEGKWISFGSLKRRASDDNLDAELLAFSNRLLRTIADAYAFGRRSPKHSR